MTRKPHLAIVGAGNLGTALAISLRRAGYVIDLVLAPSRGASLRRAQRLARRVGAHASADPQKLAGASVVWICVPDSEIALVAYSLAQKVGWKGKIALHSSGALNSDELNALRRCGAAVASAHPMMTFVRGSRPSLAGVPFAVEGNLAAVRIARRAVKDMGGHAYAIRREDKPAYHAWGTFASPLLTSLLVTTEHVAKLAGADGRAARRRMLPILRQTLANFAEFDSAEAFSGPIIRGDVDTVKRHLAVLRKMTAARDVYVALARAALEYLPAKRREELRKLLA